MDNMDEYVKIGIKEKQDISNGWLESEYLKHAIKHKGNLLIPITSIELNITGDYEEDKVKSNKEHLELLGKLKNF